MTTPTWRVRDLEKAFRVGTWPFRTDRVALHGVGIEVARGERVGLVGGSGSGKSTLVRCGLGLIRPDAGEIELLGSSTHGWSAARWRRARRTVQVLFQDPRAMLHPDVPVGALLADSAALHRPEERPRDVARQALTEVGLGERYDALPRELSGGEQRRVGIARVLLARPELLVADEPTSGLDAAVRASMVELLLQRVGSDCSVVLVSHDLSTVAQVCDRVVVMHKGRVVDRFSTTQLRESGWHPSHASTRALLEAAGWTGRKAAEA
ncbi:MAG: ATP-binding cassette domain-containing protein [Myxococcales bacterium]|nr:ATP-binding cassette domain-containing protein [Myxococcales bacterium]